MNLSICFESHCGRSHMSRGLGSWRCKCDDKASYKDKISLLNSGFSIHKLPLADNLSFSVLSSLHSWKTLISAAPKLFSSNYIAHSKRLFRFIYYDYTHGACKTIQAEAGTSCNQFICFWWHPVKVLAI